jgi:TonB-dependent starch-binding outer membrane protein SusC
MLLRRFWLVLLVMSVTGGIAHAQGRTVTGKVQEDVSLAPVPGATVTVKGTDLGAITDADGSFTIENAPAGEITLEISGPSYEAREIVVAADQQQIAVSIAPSRSEEILIVGRAPQIIRQNLANGASVVKGEELNEVSSQTVDNALQGRISGANIQSNSGAPGGGIQVKLRGISTINGESSPLFVIDGVIVSNTSVPSNIGAVTGSAGGSNPENQDNAVNRIADLNPNDIESIEVLKGPAAAALYGSKATNGVVIITTKRGRRGPPVVEVLQRFGTYTLSNKLGSRKFETMEEAIEAFGDNAAVVTAYGAGRTVDHEELLAGRERLASETFANLSGGSETTSYYASLMTRSDPGIIANTGYQKQSLRLNLDQRLGERLKIALSSNLIRSDASRSVTNNDNAILSHYMTLPFTPSFFDPRPYDDGSYPCNPFAPGSGNNPLQTSRQMSDSEETWRFIGSTSANLAVWETAEQTVNVGATLGLDRFQQTNSILFPSKLCFTAPDGAKGIALEASTEVRNMNFGVSGVYNLRPANGSFQAATTLGVQYEDSDARGISIEGRRLNPGSENVHAAQQVSVLEGRAQVRDQGMHLQQEVKLLEDRLTLLGALLAERSSANGNADRVYFYPKAATTYSIPVPVQEIELLRARLAYGETGNKPPSSFKFTPVTADENIEGNPGLVSGGIAGDPDIEPERQREIEVGIDAVGLDGRVVAELTVYQRSISDLILESRTAPSTGYLLEYLNGGAMRNRGVELMLQGTPVRMNEVSWLSRAIFSLNRSRITDLDVPAFNVRVFGTGLGEFRIEEGQSATQIVGNVTENGVTTVEKLGDAEPTFRMAFVNDVTYGDFTLSTLLDWQQGSQIINLTQFLYDGAKNSADYETAGMARAARAEAGNADPYIEDATFLKLREISLSYKLPDELISQLGPMDNALVSVSGRNLLTFSTYSGLDPEVSNFGAQTVARNVDVAPFPPSRSFWISIEAGF